MKRIYVVTHGSYDDESIEQIFSDKCLAQKFYEMKLIGDPYYNSPEEYDLIEADDELQKILRPKHTLQELYIIVGYEFDLT